MDWNGALAAVDGIVAGVFDRDELTLVPMKTGIGPNSPRMVDAGRTQFDFVGTIETDPQPMPFGERRALDPGSPRDPVRYDFVLTANVGAWPYRPNRGDVVARRGDVNERFVIEDITRDPNRPAFFLNRTKV